MTYEIMNKNILLQKCVLILRRISFVFQRYSKYKYLSKRFRGLHGCFKIQKVSSALILTSFIINLQASKVTKTNFIQYDEYLNVVSKTLEL